MTRFERIESFGQAHNALVAALAKFPRAMWQHRENPNRWSIHEILVHLADSEANCYIRFRRAVAEPGSGVYGYDQEAWATKLAYHSFDPAEALELFRWLRKLSYDLFRSVPENLWQTATVNHSENGVMTLDRLLEVYERHPYQHIEQMTRVFEDWQRKQK